MVGCLVVLTNFIDVYSDLQEELDVLLDKMQDDNKVMRSGDTVYLI